MEFQTLSQEAVQLCVWRDMLRIHGDYHTCLDIRKKLHDHAVRNYQPKYRGLYMSFMNEYAHDFRVNGAQETNYPYYYTLFTVVSQHVMGDCVEECLDKAIQAALDKQKKK